MKRIAMIAACFVALCGSALAQSESPANPAGSETLVVPPYPAETPWKKITDKSNSIMLMLEWIPADQSENDFKDILVQQTFHRMTKVTAKDFVALLLKQTTAGCASARINGPVEQTENGYPVAYGQYYCVGEKRLKQDVDGFIKVIGGKDALYVIQREFHRPAQPGAMAGITVFSGDQLEAAKAKMAAQGVANDYLVSVQLCPLVNGTAQCPVPPPAAAAPAESAPPAPPPPPAEAAKPDTGEAATSLGFTAGKSTAEDVKAKYGKPFMENHNPDGRFVLMYITPAGVYLACLFDKDGVLIRIRAYAKTQ